MVCSAKSERGKITGNLTMLLVVWAELQSRAQGPAVFQRRGPDKSILNDGISVRNGGNEPLLSLELPTKKDEARSAVSLSRVKPF
jgi:hypothetical protein